MLNFLCFFFFVFFFYYGIVLSHKLHYWLCFIVIKDIWRQSAWGNVSTAVVSTSYTIRNVPLYPTTYTKLVYVTMIGYQELLFANPNSQICCRKNVFGYLILLFSYYCRISFNPKTYILEVVKIMVWYIMRPCYICYVSKKPELILRFRSFLKRNSHYYF